MDDAVNTTFCPKQINVLDAEATTDGVALTTTELIAVFEPTHPNALVPVTL